MLSWVWCNCVLIEILTAQGEVGEGKSKSLIEKHLGGIVIQLLVARISSGQSIRDIRDMEYKAHLSVSYIYTAH